MAKRKKAQVVEEMIEQPIEKEEVVFTPEVIEDELKEEIKEEKKEAKELVEEVKEVVEQAPEEKKEELETITNTKTIQEDVISEVESINISPVKKNDTMTGEYFSNLFGIL